MAVILNMFCGNADHICVRDLFAKYLSYQKICNDNWGTCWHNFGAYYALDGSIAGEGNFASGLILNNGILIRFFKDEYIESKDCNKSSGFITKCGWIGIDVNGYRAPNKWGEDIFAFHLLENRLAPWGLPGDGRSCSRSDTGVESGWGCAAKVLLNIDY
ncbi:MAG: hypothetical protein MZV70_76400 [Desulfobacterales bacterium]|nr:hypothetical protein [Desulfobacterales bacterium]